MPDRGSKMKRWLDAFARRGHAVMFARPKQSDLATVEICTVSDFARSVRAEFGYEISEIESVKRDPPDCTAQFRGRQISIELTELVDQEMLRDLDQAQKKGKFISADERFRRTQWDAERLRRELDARLDGKQAKCARNATYVDVLIVHSAENWLCQLDVEEWLGELEFEPRPNIRSAYLLLASGGSHGPHWPVFCLYGGLDAP